jgi:hypothetical protein
MKDEEKNILLEIDKLYMELLQAPSGDWNGSYMMKPSGYGFTRIAQKLNDKVLELFNEFNPDYLTMHHVDALDHTCHKEVSYVEYHYDLSIKKNAAKKRHTEFIESMYTAIRQIDLDIFSLLLKIKEIKQ